MKDGYTRVEVVDAADISSSNSNSRISSNSSKDSNINVAANSNLSHASSSSSSSSSSSNVNLQNTTSIGDALPPSLPAAVRVLCWYTCLSVVLTLFMFQHEESDRQN